jgi:hypothetical protein|tara:strand:- start:3371 stop:3670 length:300 start_codon:yes stop_codon:yes gene_type:complete
MAKYSNTSNYSSTGQNLKYLELYSPKLTINNLAKDVKNITIGNKYNRRPDLLAYDLYGNSRYWWVFVHYNRDILKDPINDFVAGTVISIPPKSSAFGVS